MQSSASSFEPQIQALRALAATLVVLFHLWPGVVPGGFAGVDVFFVISGYLITAHLLREHEAEGTVRLGRFWARRARRLLPTALVVLAATTVGTLLWAPSLVWEQHLEAVLASLLYVENWALAAEAVDYLAADAAPTPVQHYWSLSVEEQFYVVWPLLFLRSRRRAGLAMGGVLVASFVTSVVLTQVDPAQAYFVTPTRAWEFAAGGVLALIAARPRGSFAVAASWSGWVLLGVSALVLSGTTPFPGWVALLPVAATVLVIAGGRAGPLATSPFVQRLGTISYAVYLWHWPLVVLTSLPPVAILLLTVLLAEVTTRWIEEPVRFGVLSRRPLRMTWLAAGTAMALVATPAAAGLLLVDRQSGTEEVSARIGSACFGAAAAEPGASCPPTPRSEVVPALSAVRDDVPEVYGDRCRTPRSEDGLRSCVDRPDGEPSAVVALVGDSHAAQWYPAVERLAARQGWELHVLFKAACPLSALQTVEDRTRDDGTCLRWNARVVDALRDLRPDLVLTSATTHRAWDGDADAVVAGYATRLRQVAATGAEVVVLADTPQIRDADLACVDSDTPLPRCGRPRAEALPASPLAPAVRAVRHERVHLADLNDLLCTDFCPAVVGGVLAYRDTSSHLSGTMAATMASALAHVLDTLPARHRLFSRGA